MCNHHHKPVPEHFHHLKKVLLCLCAVSRAPTSSPRASLFSFLCLYMYLPFLEISYRWNHTIGCLLCLAWLSIMFLRVHLCYSFYQCLSLFPLDSFFYWWIVFQCMDTPHFCLFIHQLVDIGIVPSFGLLQVRLL